MTILGDTYIIVPHTLAHIISCARTMTKCRYDYIISTVKRVDIEPCPSFTIWDLGSLFLYGDKSVVECLVGSSH